jgi:hypothetical protein
MRFIGYPDGAAIPAAATGKDQTGEEEKGRILVAVQESKRPLLCDLSAGMAPELIFAYDGRL